MGRTATIIAVSYVVVVVIGVPISLVIWRSTRGSGEFDTEHAAYREKRWLFIVLGTLVVLLFATIFYAPVGEQRVPGG
jgi:hypothetical protein